MGSTSTGTVWQGAAYDRSSDPQTRWGADVVQRMPAQLRGLIVDAGCGSGRVTEQLLDRVRHARVLALDASASMIEQAAVRLARHGERVRLRLHDLREPLELPEPASAVFSTGTIHWLHDHAALYRSLRRVMLQDAPLVVQAGGEGSLDEVMRVMARIHPQLAKLNHYASVARTSMDLDMAGFEPTHVWLHREPVEFDSREALARFLRDAALAPHLALIDGETHSDFIGEIVAALRAPRLDFVRLNIVARARA